MSNPCLNYRRSLVTARSLSATFTSEPQDITNVRSYSIQGSYNLTSASAQTIVVEATCFELNANIWDSIATFTLTPGSLSSFLLNVELPAYVGVRLNYTPTVTSSGPITVVLTGKL